MEKNVNKAQKLELIQNLKLQANELRKSGFGNLADQNDRIAARLERRLEKLDKLEAKEEPQAESPEPAKTDKPKKAKKAK
jgi:hypothetical protein